MAVRAKESGIARGFNLLRRFRRGAPRRARMERTGLAAAGWKRLLLASFAVFACLSAAYAVDNLLRTGESFLFAATGGALRLTGLRHVQPALIEGAFESDRGRGVYEIPLEARRRALLAIPWVEEATVMRIWPNRLWVDVRERTPVAWLRVPLARDFETTRLIDRYGTILDTPEGARFSLPVAAGISAEMPQPERQVRMDLFLRLISELDAESPRYSGQISEVDLSDPRNARVSTIYEGGVVELQMGDEFLRHRFEVYLRHLEQWKTEFGTVRSIDLRFKDQVVIK
jgi:cell division protein FtsQ